MTFLERIPKFAVTALITLAIINLLAGVILRYVVGGITNYMDWDPVPFTWVEEVGEMALAWLTLIGAAVQPTSFSLAFYTAAIVLEFAAGCLLGVVFTETILFSHPRARLAGLMCIAAGVSFVPAIVARL